jgi:hypothetical protein
MAWAASLALFLYLFWNPRLWGLLLWKKALQFRNARPQFLKFCMYCWYYYLKVRVVYLEARYVLRRRGWRRMLGRIASGHYRIKFLGKAC